MKHTKGPWNFNRTHRLSNDAWYVITDVQGRGPIIEVGGKDCNGQIAEAKYLITDPQTIEANARLIAASPTLWEACDFVYRVLEEKLERPRSGLEQACIDKLKRALEKAQGE